MITTAYAARVGKVIDVNRPSGYTLMLRAALNLFVFETFTDVFKGTIFSYVYGVGQVLPRRNLVTFSLTFSIVLWTAAAVVIGVTMSHVVLL